MLKEIVVGRLNYDLILIFGGERHFFKKLGI